MTYLSLWTPVTKSGWERQVRYLDAAKHTVCIDHHVTNPGFADVNWVVADASSASELAWETMEEEKISRHTAEALYMGIVHDTWRFPVFQYFPEDHADRREA